MNRSKIADRDRVTGVNIEKVGSMRGNNYQQENNAGHIYVNFETTEKTSKMVDFLRARR